MRVEFKINNCIVSFAFKGKPRRTETTFLFKYKTWKAE